MSILDFDQQALSAPPLQEEITLEETGDVEEENSTFNGVSAYVLERYHRARDKRKGDEERWIRAYDNYRGIYNSNVKFSSEEKSKLFVKATKTKVLAAYAQLTEVLFSGNKFPIGVEPSPVPVGDTPEAVHFEAQQQQPNSPGSATTARPEFLGVFKELLGKVPGLKTGVGKSPTAVTYYPVQEAARKMEKKIHDQLEESDAASHLRYMSFELCLFGHGVIKGPFLVNKEYPKWTSEGTYEPVTEKSAKINGVSIWNFYPDPEGKTMTDCEYVIERHRLSRSQLRALTKRPGFRKESIELAVEGGPNYIKEQWEHSITDNSHEVSNERYEVLEFWGTIDTQLAEDAGIELPDEVLEEDEVHANIWICNGQILRFVVNPFTPTRIPYHAVPFEINPYSFFGIGVAENMEDMQMLMNGTARMMVDNLALSGNVLIEVDETNLVPGQDMTVYPGKVFRRQGGAPGQAIFSTKFTNVTPELIQVYDKARQIADEATSIPSYSHGGTGVTGMGRTASGMSMLMGAAAQTIKSIVRNIDDYLLAPLGRDMFAFNMQFDFDKEYTQGDLSIVPRGTESLMRNEIRSQRLLQFFQIAAANPMTAPFVKIDYVLREIAASMDLDEEKVLNDPREAAVQAAIMGQIGGQGGPGGQGGAVGSPEAGAMDPTGTGGGVIAPGNSPTPGADGFTGGGERPGVNGQPQQ